MSEGEITKVEGAAALAHMEAALGLLDKLDLDVEVGGLLDLAINRLRNALQRRQDVPKLTDDQPPSD